MFTFFNVQETSPSVWMLCYGACLYKSALLKQSSLFGWLSQVWAAIAQYVLPVFLQPQLI